MDPVTAVVIAVVAALAAGFGAGWGLKPDASVEALKAQAGAIEALQEGQAEILAEVNQPLVIDAEMKAALAKTPVQCRKDAGGDPRSVECQWATCLQFGQSPAQRPECRAVEELMLAELKGCKE
jgi:hypothetical protein